jgi:outer membrane protein assembly factor BamA
MYFWMALLGTWAGSVFAQQDTRAAEIEKAREAKAQALKEESVSKTESRLLRFKDEKYLERFAAGFNGWRPKIGGMATGGGFALGPEYSRNDFFDGHLQFRASAQASTQRYIKFETELIAPYVLKDKGYLSFHNVHQNYGRIAYYGPGPDSEKTGRSNYRLENTSTELTGALRPYRHIKVGATVGYLWVNVGPGADSRFISADKQYSPLQSPGIDHQTNFQRNGVFIQHDTRDNPFGPKMGGNYLFQYTWFDDRKLNQFNFRRMDAEIQQFIPFFNRTRVFGFRAKTVLTEGDREQSTPFYFMPTVGGSDDLRGYRPFRFSDRNSLVLNGEYRWQVFDGLDAAVFVDAGKVFHRRGQLNFSNLESSVGFGLRFNVRNSTFLRTDVGFSHEGFQVWIKFSDIFAQRVFGASLAQPVF